MSRKFCSQKSFIELIDKNFLFTGGRTGRNAFFYPAKPGFPLRFNTKARRYSWPQSLHPRSGRGQALLGQSRCADRRNRDNAARSHTAL